MTKISPKESVGIYHGNGLNPEIDNQKISLILTVSMLVNLYRENFKMN